MNNLPKSRISELKECLSQWLGDYDPEEEALQHNMFSDAMAAMDMLLAGMEQEPIAYIRDSFRMDGVLFCRGVITAEEHERTKSALSNRYNWKVQPLYAAPVVSEHQEREQVRQEHAEWSQATFGNIGPVGPLKHLSKEALEAAAEPGDLSEWADMQFLLWDAQRRAGITDEQITQAMIEKLAVNKARKWPEPKDGEPRLHIKEQSQPQNAPQNIPENIPEPVSNPYKFPENLNQKTKELVINFASALAEKLYKSQEKHGYSNNWQFSGWEIECQEAFYEHIAKGDPRDVAAYCAFMWYHGWKTELPQQSANSPVIPDGWKFVPIELTIEMQQAWDSAPNANTEDEDINMCTAYRAMLSAAPKPPVSDGWIKCSERMPDDRKSVLLWDADLDDALSGHYSHKTGVFYCAGMTISNEISHWMPLPNPPAPEA